MTFGREHFGLVNFKDKHVSQCVLHPQQYKLAFVSLSLGSVKYLGLLAMSKILKTHPRSVQAHKDLVLQCLDDKDESIRLRALDLLYGMVRVGISREEHSVCLVWQVGQSRKPTLNSVQLSSNDEMQHCLHTRTRGSCNKRRVGRDSTQVTVGNENHILKVNIPYTMNVNLMLFFSSRRVCFVLG